MRRVLQIAPVVIVTLLFATHVWCYRQFLVDDTFITLRFVQQWVHGNGLVYNLGETVEGYSNFLWILLLAPFAVVGADLVVVAKLLGLVCSLLTLLISLLLARRLELALPWGASLLLAVSAPFAAWTMGGLETPLFTLLLTLASYLFIAEEQERAERGWYSGVVFALLALARPEGVIFAPIAIGWRVARLWRQRKLTAQRDWQRGVALLTIVLPFHAWRIGYYGHLLPNTVEAKSMGLHLRGLLEGGFYLYQSMAAMGGWLAAVLLVLALLARSRQASNQAGALPFGPAFGPAPARAYIAMNVGVYTGLVLLGGGDWMPLQRFLVHILPLVYLLLLGAIFALAHHIVNRSARWAAVLGVVLVIGQAGYLASEALQQVVRPDDQTRALFARDAPSPWIELLREQVRPGDTIAVVDAGLVAYSLPLDVRVVDMIGLTDRHIASQTPQFPSGLLGSGDGFGKWDVDYVLAQQPAFVQVHLLEQRPDGAWLTDFTGTTLLVNDARFRRDYPDVQRFGRVAIFARQAQR